MKLILVFIFLLLDTSTGWSQATDSLIVFSKKKVSIITVFNKNNETKDGYYINGYVVNISHERGQELHLKKIIITGKVTIVKKIKPPESGEDIQQGRNIDTRHILKPTIKIIN